MKIVPGVEYTKEDIAKFRDDPELAKVLLKGYVFTLTIGGNFMLVPWHKAAIDMGKGSTYGEETRGVFDKRELPPIVKRTPQQRVQSLMDKVGEDLRHLLSGEAGHEVTGEETRKVAQKFLESADYAREEAQSKKVVREDGNPYA